MQSLAQHFEVVCYGTTPTHRLRDLIEDGTYLDYQGPFTQWREYISRETRAKIILKGSAAVSQIFMCDVITSYRLKKCRDHIDRVLVGAGSSIDRELW